MDSMFKDRFSTFRLLAVAFGWTLGEFLRDGIQVDDFDVAIFVVVLIGFEFLTRPRN